jgi:hypothetical protein
MACQWEGLCNIFIKSIKEIEVRKDTRQYGDIKLTKELDILIPSSFLKERLYMYNNTVQSTWLRVHTSSL